MAGLKVRYRSVIVQSECLEKRLDDEVKRFWELESIGIVETEEDDDFKKRFKESIQHNGQRYEAELQRKEFHKRLPDNFLIAKKRLKSMLRKLKTKHELFKRYNDYFHEQLDRGFIEEVPQDDNGPDDWTHYIPHHAVIKEDRETTKVRIVFDASCSSSENSSLNQYLEAGQSMIPELYDVMLRFR